MHTEPSQLFRAARIPGHRMQVYASARVLVWFSAHHSPAAVARHQARLLAALEHMAAAAYSETVLDSEQAGR